MRASRRERGLGDGRSKQQQVEQTRILAAMMELLWQLYAIYAVDNRSNRGPQRS
jgi:hypothetical protein